VIDATSSEGFLLTIALYTCVACVCYVLDRNASLFSGCVNTIDCSSVSYGSLFLDVITARRHAELYLNVCADARREGPSLVSHSAVHCV